jgi:hypothetical protein
VHDERVDRQQAADEGHGRRGDGELLDRKAWARAEEVRCVAAGLEVDAYELALDVDVELRGAVGGAEVALLELVGGAEDAVGDG